MKNCGLCNLHYEDSETFKGHMDYVHKLIDEEHIELGSHVKQEDLVGGLLSPPAHVD